MYIELDHNLVAGNVENINEKVVLEGRKEQEREAALSEDWRTDEYLLNKYNISKQPVKDILLKKESESPKVIRSDSLEQIAKVNMAKMANGTFVPCVLEMEDFASAFLFSLETQHTIGYGSRYQ